MMTFKNDLYQLLSITASSGREEPVANYLNLRLKSLTDKVWFDDYRNVLAEMNYGENGPTVLLSAHMDTVWVEEDREIIQDDDVWFSSHGPLGADDRAGIAIILAVLRNLGETGFAGKVKLAFTREEEIGLCGSREIDPEWLKGIDLGIVVDRRGSRDAAVFAEQGVPSINVSAGYMNEHTDREYVNILHCQDTIRLLLHVMKHCGEDLFTAVTKNFLRR